MTVETATRESSRRSDLGFSPRALARLDRAFVVIALVFGNALIVVTPPFQVADEAQHFFRAWQITQGEFVSRGRNSLGQDGGYLPASLELFWNRFYPMAIHPERKTTAKFVIDSMRIPLEPEKTEFVPFSNTTHYCPVSYLPQCLGVGLGRALSLPLPVILDLGRETNLLVFAFLGYLSLRWAPAIARPLFLLMLMPTMLALAASVSADTFNDALAIVFTALICRYFAAGADSIDSKAIALLALVSVPLSVGKYVYVPLLAMLLLIPTVNFGGMARKGVVIFALIAMNLAALAAWSASTSSLDTRISTEKNISPAEQLSRLEHNPLHFAPLLWNTAKDGGWFVCTTYVAVIGWMDLNFPPPMVIAYLGFLIFACWTAGGRWSLPPPGKAALNILPAIAVSFLGIALLNFLYWTPIGSNYILGLQGRYFFPLTPAIFLLLCSAARRFRGFQNTSRREFRLNAAMIAISLMYCASLVIAVWKRFYI